MTAYEIYQEIGTAKKPEYYKMAILMDSDTEAASQLIQDHFKCDKEIADESIAIMNRTVEDDLRRKGIEPLTREQMALNNEVERLNRLEQQNQPKCPICGSVKLSKITTTKKVMKIAAFGIFGMGDNGKTYKCDNCGSKF